MVPRQPSLAYVILAAGLGSRLGAALEGKPKWMVPVSAEVTVADHQLSALESVVADAPRIVVAGAHADAVDELAAARPELGLDVVFNEHYSEWNNWYSVLVALERLDAIGWDGATLVINGDLLCPRSWFGDFAAATEEWGDVTLAVDATRGRTDEAMKVETKGERITAVRKTGITSPFGEYIGLTGLSVDGRKILGDALRRLGEEGRVNDWYEGGIQRVIDEGGDVRYWQTPAEDWVEIDDESDLATARRVAEAIAETSES